MMNVMVIIKVIGTLVSCAEAIAQIVKSNEK